MFKLHVCVYVHIYGNIKDLCESYNSYRDASIILSPVWWSTPYTYMSSLYSQLLKYDIIFTFVH